ncbi:archease [Geotalea sp. SG265]|uniref:archease n=1 Tax=Geotalea sp. SG265 TaxID=2922867 RepID=UPI001FAF62EF|nr:archease [Geotalea sp. SG265]
MPYRYLEEIATADTAFEATGSTLEEVFTAAADALLNTMTADVTGIAPEETTTFETHNAELDLLLFDVLNELVFLKDAKRLLLRIQSIAFSHDKEMYRAKITARGERIDPARHRLLVDVKAVTLHRFSLEETEHGWKACVVLDI